MFLSRVVFAVAVAGVVLSGNLPRPAGSARAQTLKSDGSVEIAGQSLRCGTVRVSLDRRIPSEGAAAPGILILNPRMLSAQPETVRLFVFYHECGHLHVGEGELEADCWAIELGVREGWLDKKGIGQVCQSFDGMPETETHPSARSRCRNLDQCFTTSVAVLSQSRPAGSNAVIIPRRPGPAHSPRLVSGPKLVATGIVRYSDR
jgi:hypothetical protein